MDSPTVIAGAAAAISAAATVFAFMQARAAQESVIEAREALRISKQALEAVEKANATAASQHALSEQGLLRDSMPTFELTALSVRSMPGTYLSFWLSSQKPGSLRHLRIRIRLLPPHRSAMWVSVVSSERDNIVRPANPQPIVVDKPVTADVVLPRSVQYLASADSRFQVTLLVSSNVLGREWRTKAVLTVENGRSEPVLTTLYQP